MPRSSPPQSSWSERSAWRVPRRRPTAAPPPAALRPPTRARTTATTEPVATEAPATEAPATAAAATEAPATEAPATEAPVATEATASTEARETVPPVVTQLDPTTAIDINPQPRDALQQGGEFRLESAIVRRQLEPRTTRSATTSTTPRSCSRCRTTCGRLRRRRRRPRLDPNYVLESSTSEGTPGEPFTVTYKLNPDAHWNNGDPIDVDDYIANWQALNGIDHPDFPVASTEGYDRITSVEQGADKFEVVITFDDVYPDYQALFDLLAPAESLQPDTYVDGWTEINTDWFTGRVHPRLDRHDAGHPHRGPQPELVGRQAAARQDHLPRRQPRRRADELRQRRARLLRHRRRPERLPDRQHHAAAAPSGRRPGPNWRHITFNTTAGLLADQTIRQAIVRSLDRADIGSSDLAGIPWPAQPLNNHIFVENQAGYVDNAGDFAYDPERAMADLDAAGWVRRRRRHPREGRPAPHRQATASSSACRCRRTRLGLVQSQLAEVGIEVNIVDVPVGGLQQRARLA